MYPNLRQIHVQAVVLMTADDVHIVDRRQRQITSLTAIISAYFQSSNTIPERRLKDIRSLLPTVKRAIQGRQVLKALHLAYGDWQVEEKLGGSHTRVPCQKMFMDGWTVRLRVYKIDPYQDTAEQRPNGLISNAFQAVFKIPHIQTFWGTRLLQLTMATAWF